MKYNFTKDFAIGADISWYPQMLQSGFVFRNKHKQEQELLQTLKDYNMDTIRLRTWVNPSDHPRSGHCSASDTLAFAKKCSDMGYRIMLNFHYSDSWADPGKQVIPAAWAKLEFDELVQQFYNYTYDTIDLLVSSGVVLEWAQIGNETNPGMMLPVGSTSDFKKLAQLYNTGHDAIKAASTNTKTMIHLAEINSTDFIIDYFSQLEQHGCRYDMMAFSFYPYHLPKLSYETCIEGFKRSLIEIPTRFGKDFMLVETGGVDEQEAETYQLLTDIITAMEPHPKCKGILLWEPQGAKVWSGYSLSAWRADGTPSAALEALCNINKI